MANSELPNVAPFVIKCYDIVDDPTTNGMISWSAEGDSIVIWDEVALARDIFPNYFKHNNMNSFIRQLQSYGFHKLSADRVEYANELFVKGRLDDLHKIIRKDPTKDAAEHLTPELHTPKLDILELLQEIHQIDKEKYKQMKKQVVELFQSQVDTFKKLYNLEKQVEAMAQSNEQMLSILMCAYMDYDDLDENDPRIQNNLDEMCLSLENVIRNN